MSPRFSSGQPDRSLELEQHLEPLFEVMLTVAVSVGYTQQEACCAIISLAAIRQLANSENFVTEAKIVQAAKWPKGD